MQIALRRKQRISRKSTLAAVLAATLGAAGTAVAVSPIIEPPIAWQGGVEISTSIVGPAALYNVPAGRSFLMTDLVLTSLSGSALVTIYTINTNDCAGSGTAKSRLSKIAVTEGASTVVALQTGVGFTAGQAVCVTASSTASTNVEFNARGFLFTPKSSS